MSRIRSLSGRPRRPAAAALPCALLLLGACSHPVERPNVVLVTLDTTRADHIGAYGYRGARTPVLDRLAAEGVLFERAWSVTPLTTPAHSSILTGLFPAAHGVRNNGRFRLPDEAETLAEAFHRAGYRTGAFVAAFPVTRAFGLSQGFDVYDDDFGAGDRGSRRSERRADEVNSRALPWIAEAAAATEPFFAWIHYYDAHDPYTPPGRLAAEFRGREYDGEIAFADERLGEVVELLRSRRLLDRTVIAVCGDHGEGLGDHGEPTHGLLVYEPMLRVPLVIRAPWKLPRGERSRDLASLVDIAPTLLALAGLPALAGIHGQDLDAPRDVSSAGGEDPLRAGPGRVLYAESFYGQEEFGWAPLVTVRRSGQKWIAAPRPERFDLDADPGEESNLAGADPGKDHVLESLLARVAEAASQSGLARTETGDSEDLVERLQSLGYVGGGAGTAPGTPAAARARDPKDAVGDYNAYLQGTEMLKTQRAGDAVPVFRSLVENDPDNAEFRMRLGMAYRASGDLEAAERTYRDVVRRHPDFYLGYRRLAALLESQGRMAESRDLWLALKGRGGRFVGLEARLANAYLGAGEPDKALAVAEGELAKGAPDAELLATAGQALEALGRDDEAAERYRAVLALTPADLKVLDALANVLTRRGRAAEIGAVVEDCLRRAPDDPALRDRAAAWK